jgi:phosphocarrier protein HPr
MPTETLKIINRLGLHARAAAKFMQLAANYTCEIKVDKQGKAVNGKSIMGLMMLAAAQGSELTVSTQGDDAEQALAALRELVENRFGEPE